MPLRAPVLVAVPPAVSTVALATVDGVAHSSYRSADGGRVIEPSIVVRAPRAEVRVQEAMTAVLFEAVDERATRVTLQNAGHLDGPGLGRRAGVRSRSRRCAADRVATVGSARAR